MNVKSFIDPRRCHPPSYPRRPTSDARGTHTTPRRTTLHYATAASHPPEYASHPTSERGRSLFREANLYAHPAHVWVNVCTGWRCACVGGEFRNEGRIYGLAGLDFSPRALFRPSFKVARTSFRFPRGNSFPKFRRGKSSLLPRWHRLLRFVAVDWTMHEYVHDASPFPNPAV